MKINFSIFAGTMVWGTLPLLGCLFYWEHTLHLFGSGNILMQILLLIVVTGWAYFWHMEAEIDRLRHLFDSPAKKTMVRYYMITDSFYGRELMPKDCDASYASKAVLKDEKAVETPFQKVQYTIEVRSHVTND